MQVSFGIALWNLGPEAKPDEKQPSILHLNSVAFISERSSAEFLSASTLSLSEVAGKAASCSFFLILQSPDPTVFC